MNLVVDVGNTLVKLAVFSDEVLKYKKTCLKTAFLSTLSELQEQYGDITHAVVASVGELSEHQLRRLHKRYTVLEITSNTPMPFQNQYKTPTTLGVDRLGLMSAAASQYPGQNVLVIDAGSAVTYDLLTKENMYRGGSISPGLAMRYKALHTFTAKLPLLDTTIPETLMGNSTITAIHTGVVHGLVFEIQGFITQYTEDYNDLTVILTGGDAHFLRDRLKNDIFANSNFLLEGLNYILEHNKD